MDSPNLDLIIRVVLAFTGMLPVLGYYLLTGRTGLKIALFKERAAIGGPTAGALIRFHIANLMHSSGKPKEGQKPKEPPKKPEATYLAAAIPEEDLISTRQHHAFKRFLAEDDQPAHPRFPHTPLRVLLRYMRLGFIAIIAAGLLFPPLGIALGIAWVIIAATLRSRARARFLERWQLEDALIQKARDILAPFMKLPVGDLDKPYMAWRWIEIPEWNGGSPKEFTIRLPGDYSPTKAQRLLVQEAWESRMSARADASWGWEWHLDQGYVTARVFPPIPQMARLPFPAAPDIPWNTVPLGIDQRGKVVHWDIEAVPNAITMGKIGSGKSIQLNVILLDLLQDPMWSVYIADRKEALETYMHADGCLGFESTPEGILDMFRNLQAENERRKKILKENGMKKWYNLPDKIRIDGELVDRPPLIMFVVEEAIDLLGKEGVKEVDAMKAEMKGLLLKMIATMRSQGIYLIMVIQRPDAEFVGGALRENISARIQVGAMGASASRMLFETDIPEEYFLKDPSLDDDGSSNVLKGRAAFSSAIGSYTIFQGFFVEDDDEPLKRALSVCNRVRSGGARRPIMRQPQSPASAGDVAPEDRVLAVVNRLLGRVGVEVYKCMVQITDEDSGEPVERSRLRIRRARRATDDDATVEQTPRRRAATTATVGENSPGEGGGLSREEIKAKVRARREEQQKRTAQRADSGAGTPGTPSPVESTSGGLPVARFTDTANTDTDTTMSDHGAVDTQPPVASSTATAPAAALDSERVQAAVALMNNSEIGDNEQRGTTTGGPEPGTVSEVTVGSLVIPGVHRPVAASAPPPPRRAQHVPTPTSNDAATSEENSWF
jgi:hypothetical protein